jgi:hypothetical protein
LLKTLVPLESFSHFPLILWNYDNLSTHESLAVCRLIPDQCSTQFLQKYHHNQHIQTWVECIACFYIDSVLFLFSCQCVKKFFFLLILLNCGSDVICWKFSWLLYASQMEIQQWVLLEAVVFHNCHFPWPSVLDSLLGISFLAEFHVF